MGRNVDDGRILAHEDDGATRRRIEAGPDDVEAPLQARHPAAPGQAGRGEDRRAGGAVHALVAVDALTQLNGELRYAGDRTEADIKVAQLLALAV